MLVLTRKLGEQILIGDSITLTVMELDRGRVRLAFEAPKSVPIYRQEIVDARAEAELRKSEANCPVAALYRDEAQEAGGAGE